jgi:hypothetical protein
VHKQYNNQVRLEEKSPVGGVSPGSQDQTFQVENSGASNFATSFKDGRENYETKMTALRRSHHMGVRGGIELVLCEFIFR